ncbi:hypothetical protein Clacol_005909 [Clathrus columnatus]|uniref:Uncharacterized protein n=1 Tax=Clathrus columnatus TaxID=1419009 RepID=A0AAV5ADV1_9AGAM|nr:hypothetical protein Clacol_005909 [Clathrus columnatus]
MVAHPVAFQVQNSIEIGSIVGGTVYQNTTTLLDVKREFATIVATTDQLVAGYNALPVVECTGDHILALTIYQQSIFI